MKKQSTINKILCTTLILAFTTQCSFAVPNYVLTTTTNEQYSAATPVGKFQNYTSNGMGYNITPVPAYDYNYYYPNVAVNTPAVNYGVPVYNGVNYGSPVYNAGVSYGGPESKQNYSAQDIQTPQDYNKTVTTTTQSVDTREKADKIIDRGMKVVGTLAVVGAVAGLIIGSCNK